MVVIVADLLRSNMAAMEMTPCSPSPSAQHRACDQLEATTRRSCSDEASSRGRYMATSRKQSGRIQGSLCLHQGLRRVRMARIGYINLTGSYNLWAEGSNLLSTVMPESTTCRQVPGSNARGRDSLTCMTSRFQHRAANVMHDRSVDMANRWRHSWAVMHQSFGRLQQRR
jgi:hypothetical protein